MAEDCIRQNKAKSKTESQKKNVICSSTINKNLHLSEHIGKQNIKYMNPTNYKIEPTLFLLKIENHPINIDLFLAQPWFAML